MTRYGSSRSRRQLTAGNGYGYVLTKTTDKDLSNSTRSCWWKSAGSEVVPTKVVSVFVPIAREWASLAWPDGREGLVKFRNVVSRADCGRRPCASERKIGKYSTVLPMNW